MRFFVIIFAVFFITGVGFCCQDAPSSDTAPDSAPAPEPSAPAPDPSPDPIGDCPEWPIGDCGDGMDTDGSFWDDLMEWLFK